MMARACTSLWHAFKTTTFKRPSAAHITSLSIEAVTLTVWPSSA